MEEESRSPTHNADLRKSKGNELYNTPSSGVLDIFSIGAGRCQDHLHLKHNMPAVETRKCFKVDDVSEYSPQHNLPTVILRERELFKKIIVRDEPTVTALLPRSENFIVKTAGNLDSGILLNDGGDESSSEPVSLGDERKEFKEFYGLIDGYLSRRYSAEYCKKKCKQMQHTGQRRTLGTPGLWSSEFDASSHQEIRKQHEEPSFTGKQNGTNFLSSLNSRSRVLAQTKDWPCGSYIWQLNPSESAEHRLTKSLLSSLTEKIAPSMSHKEASRFFMACYYGHRDPPENIESRVAYEKLKSCIDYEVEYFRKRDFSSSAKDLSSVSSAQEDSGTTEALKSSLINQESDEAKDSNEESGSGNTLFEPKSSVFIHDFDISDDSEVDSPQPNEASSQPISLDTSFIHDFDLSDDDSEVDQLQPKEASSQHTSYDTSLSTLAVHNKTNERQVDSKLGCDSPPQAEHSTSQHPPNNTSFIHEFDASDIESELDYEPDDDPPLQEATTIDVPSQGKGYMATLENYIDTLKTSLASYNIRSASENPVSSSLDTSSVLDDGVCDDDDDDGNESMYIEDNCARSDERKETQHNMSDDTSLSSLTHLTNDSEDDSELDHDSKGYYSPSPKVKEPPLSNVPSTSSAQEYYSTSENPVVALKSCLTPYNARSKTARRAISWAPALKSVRMFERDHARSSKKALPSEEENRLDSNMNPKSCQNTSVSSSINHLDDSDSDSNYEIDLDLTEPLLDDNLSYRTNKNRAFKLESAPRDGPKNISMTSLLKTMDEIAPKKGKKRPMRSDDDLESSIPSKHTQRSTDGFYHWSTDKSSLNDDGSSSEGD